MLGLTLCALGWLPANAAGQDQAELQPVGVASVDESAVDPATLNLWRPSGRGRIVVDRQTRELLHTVAIVDRPGRPLHFYGNAVRRRAYGIGWNLSSH
jgi:hypothetical protein